MSKLYQIYEDDLVEMERVVPELCSAFAAQIQNRQRVQLERLKIILSNVRWNYMPPRCVEVIPVDPIG